MENNKYKNSKIFEIINKKGRFIGSTFSLALSNKLASYRRDYLNYIKGLKKYNVVFEILKHGCYKINLLELYSCSSIDELRAREQFWIEKLSCINKDYENFENDVSQDVKIENDVSQDVKIENDVSQDEKVENDAIKIEADVSQDVKIENDVSQDEKVENNIIDKPNNFEKIRIKVEPFKFKIEEPTYDIRQKTKIKKKKLNSTRKTPFVFDKIKQLDKIEKKITKSIDFKFESESESESDENESESDEEEFEFIDGDYNNIIDKYNTSETMSFLALCKENLLKKGRTDIIDKCFEKYNSFVKTDMTLKSYAKDMIQNILKINRLT